MVGILILRFCSFPSKSMSTYIASREQSSECLLISLNFQGSFHVTRIPRLKCQWGSDLLRLYE